MMKIRNFRGMTIIELLIYMALVSIFMIVLVELFTNILSLQLTTESTSNLTQDTRLIIARMGYDIENASSITNPSALGQTTNTLSFKDSGGATHTYLVDGSNNLTLDGVKLNSLDTSISGSSLSFQAIGTDIVKPTIQVKFTINSNVKEPSGVRNQVIQITYALR